MRASLPRLVLACLGLSLAVAAEAAHAAGPAPSSPSKAAPRPSRQVALPRSAGLSDTVLARIGDRRRVTATDFRHAWEQLTPPTRPDSLTPESARRFLDLLIDKEVLAEAALRQPFRSTALESAQVASLRDQLMLKAALDSALSDARRRRAAAGDSALDDQQLGIAVRDSSVSRMAIRYDEPVVLRMSEVWRGLPRPARDSSLFAQIRALGTLPVVDAADSGRVIAQSADGPYTVRELLEAWRATNPLSRPRIDRPDQIKDLIHNGLFERRLRLAAERRHLDRRPDIAAAIARRREYQAVTHFVNREVYEKLPEDSLTLERFYKQHAAEYDLPDRAEVIRLVLPTRAEAGRMAARLRVEADAESLAQQGRRARVNYRGEISARTDSVLFAQAMKAGVGAVVGPDTVAGGWQVARVSGIRLARRRDYEEVRDGVQQHHYNLEGERLMRDLVDRLRRQTRVVTNPAAIDRVTKT